MLKGKEKFGVLFAVIFAISAIYLSYSFWGNLDIEGKVFESEDQGLVVENSNLNDFIEKNNKVERLSVERKKEGKGKYGEVIVSLFYKSKDSEGVFPLGGMTISLFWEGPILLKGKRKKRPLMGGERFNEQVSFGKSRNDGKVFFKKQPYGKYQCKDIDGVLMGSFLHNKPKSEIRIFVKNSPKRVVSKIFVTSSKGSYVPNAEVFSYGSVNTGCKHLGKTNEEGLLTVPLSRVTLPAVWAARYPDGVSDLVDVSGYEKRIRLKLKYPVSRLFIKFEKELEETDCQFFLQAMRYRGSSLEVHVPIAFKGFLPRDRNLISILPSQFYRLLLFKKGMRLLKKNIELKPGEQKTLHISFKKSHILSGRVWDRFKRPIAGQQVFLVSNFPGKDRFFKAVTDKAGRYTLKSLPKGWIEIWVGSRDKYHSFTIFINAERDQQHDFMLQERPKRISGKCLDFNGKLFPGLKVQIHGNSPPSMGNRKQYFSEKYTDESGEFLFEGLGPRVYELVFYQKMNKGGYFPFPSKKETVNLSKGLSREFVFKIKRVKECTFSGSFFGFKGKGFCLVRGKSNPSFGIGRYLQENQRFKFVLPPGRFHAQFSLNPLNDAREKIVWFKSFMISNGKDLDLGKEFVGKFGEVRFYFRGRDLKIIKSVKRLFVSSEDGFWLDLMPYKGKKELKNDSIVGPVTLPYGKYRLIVGGEKIPFQATPFLINKQGAKEIKLQLITEGSSVHLLFFFPKVKRARSVQVRLFEEKDVLLGETSLTQSGNSSLEFFHNLRPGKYSVKIQTSDGLSLNAPIEIPKTKPKNEKPFSFSFYLQPK
jgi:hypothetical protein